jgi:hypothetical protein
MPRSQKPLPDPACDNSFGAISGSPDIREPVTSAFARAPFGETPKSPASNIALRQEVWNPRR